MRDACGYKWCLICVVHFRACFGNTCEVLRHCTELKEQDMQRMMTWSAEDAIANYDVAKTAIETAAAAAAAAAAGAGGHGKMSGADAPALRYLVDVFRYCMNIATTKQVWVLVVGLGVMMLRV
jgi:hypothetical protein